VNAMQLKRLLKALDSYWLRNSVGSQSPADWQKILLIMQWKGNHFANCLFSVAHKKEQHLHCAPQTYNQINSAWIGRKLDVVWKKKRFTDEMSL